MYLFDEKGNRYLDLIGGWATNALGHSPKVIQKALKEQSSLLINCSPAFYNPEMLRLANLLCRVSKMDKAFFCSSGLEANESALKLCRKYASLHQNNAHEIISLKGGFHGRSLALMAVSGKKGWNTLFNPKLKGVKHARPNDFDDLQKKITPKTSAIFMELIQGEGGVREVSSDYIAKVKKLTQEKNIVLVIDEIQTGIARTGKMFAFEHYGIKPDILTLAKGLGGGFPIGSMLTTKKFDVFSAGENGSTFSAQPLAMRVGRAVLEEVIEKKLSSHAREMGDLFKKKLGELAKEIPLNHIRGKGLLLGFDLGEISAQKLSEQCFKNGLLINALSEKSIRLMPPLIIQEKEINTFIALFKKSYQEIA